MNINMYNINIMQYIEQTLEKQKSNPAIVPTLVIDIRRIASRCRDRSYSVAFRFRLDFVRRAFNFACEHAFATMLPLLMMLRFVAMQRDPTFRAAYRSGFTRVRAVRRACTFAWKRGCIQMWLRLSYFKPDASRIASKSHSMQRELLAF